MRIAIVYDCLYPNTIGGAERWLRVLAERLGRDHQVTYITRRQWARDDAPVIEGVRCVAVSRGGSLYTSLGRRRLPPPLLFGLGVFSHFLRHRRDYDIVHCPSYPFVSLIALRMALMGRRRTKVFCEWLEYVTADYWRAYAGRVGGLLGRTVQRLALRLSPSAFCFSDLVESRLRRSGFRGELHRLTGLWANGHASPPRTAVPPGPPLVLFAGRHVPDKRVAQLPEALAIARRERPDVRCVIVGDGPERPRVLEAVERLGLSDAVSVPGFVDRAELNILFARASCLASPSIRDGHGMVVAEAAAAGVPVAVCRHPDNAATELVEHGVNGAIAAGTAASEIAAAILAVLDGGAALRETTAAWFTANRERLSMASSIERVCRLYDGKPAPAEQPPAHVAPAGVSGQVVSLNGSRDPVPSTNGAVHQDSTASARGATP